MNDYRIYRKGDQIEAGAMPTILAIGDSWFWYPFPHNLLKALCEHPLLLDACKNIQLLGENGARLSEYLDGPNADEWKAQLEPKNFQYFTVVLISGAGNDAVKYHLALCDDCSNFTTAAQCISTQGMKDLVDGIVSDMRTLIEQVAKAAEAYKKPYPIEVFFHGYDYPVPDGRGFQILGIKVSGPWLKRALDRCHVPQDIALRTEIVHNLIDTLNEAFKRLAATFIGSKLVVVNYIDSRNTLYNDQKRYQKNWLNELHPNSNGFRKLVNQCWIPAFQERNLASKK